MERIYYSLEELNHNVRRIVDNLNDRKIQSQSFSRREAFDSYDKPKMRPPDQWTFLSLRVPLFPEGPQQLPPAL